MIVDDEYDQVPNEVMGHTVYDEPTDLLARTSPPTDAIADAFRSRELPPLPVMPDALSMPHDTDNYSYAITAEEIINGMVCDEPQIDAGISASNVTLLTAEQTPYSALEPSTREPPPSPVVYDRLCAHGYVNTNIATSEETGDIICDETQIDPGSSSNVSSLSADEASYSRLESSTREPPPASVAYDRLVRPEYVNVTTVSCNTEVMTGLSSDELQSDSGIPLTQLSEVESTV